VVNITVFKSRLKSTGFYSFDESLMTKLNVILTHTSVGIPYFLAGLNRSFFAAQRFDETRGFKFISYAVWWIRQSIMQALAEQSRIVRLPLNGVGNISKINRAYAKLEQEFEREPDSREIADLLQVDEEEVRTSLKTAGRHISMDAPLLTDDDNSLYDILESQHVENPDKELIHDSLRIEIERAISTLTAREADVLRMYYGLNSKIPLSLEEIAVNYDLTRERVRQIKERAIRRLKQTSRSKYLKAYLG